MLMYVTTLIVYGSLSVSGIYTDRQVTFNYPTQQQCEKFYDDDVNRGLRVLESNTGNKTTVQKCQPINVLENRGK